MFMDCRFKGLLTGPYEFIRQKALYQKCSAMYGLNQSLKYLQRSVKNLRFSLRSRLHEYGVQFQVMSVKFVVQCLSKKRPQYREFNFLHFNLSSGCKF